MRAMMEGEKKFEKRRKKQLTKGDGGDIINKLSAAAGLKKAARPRKKFLTTRTCCAKINKLQAKAGAAKDLEN